MLCVAHLTDDHPLHTDNSRTDTMLVGGKSPSIIFNDADVSNALAMNSQGFLMNSGQVSRSTNKSSLTKIDSLITLIYADMCSMQSCVCSGKNCPRFPQGEFYCSSNTFAWIIICDLRGHLSDLDTLVTGFERKVPRHV